MTPTAKQQTCTIADLRDKKYTLVTIDTDVDATAESLGCRHEHEQRKLLGRSGSAVRSGPVRLPSDRQQAKGNPPRFGR